MEKLKYDLMKPFDESIENYCENENLFGPQKGKNYFILYLEHIKKERVFKPY